MGLFAHSHYGGGGDGAGERGRGAELHVERGSREQRDGGEAKPEKAILPEAESDGGADVFGDLCRNVSRWVQRSAA